MNSENNNNTDILNNVETLDFEEETENNQESLENKFVKPVEAVPVPPKISELGGIPSGDWEQPKKEKKKFNFKILWIILILLLIVGIGVGLYYFLVYAKNNTQDTVLLEDKTVELGEDLNEDIRTYAKNANDCSIDLSNVDVSKIGKYEYKVKCSKKEYTANVEVKDTTPPQITLAPKNIKLNDTIDPRDFVLASYDLSDITYSFTEDITNYTKAYGVYVVGIEAKDVYNNKTVDHAILIVSNVVATKFLSATKEQTTTYNATLTINDKIGFNNTNYYVNATRIYEYAFKNEDDYKKAKSEYEEKKSINNESGLAIFNEETLSIQLVKALTIQDLNALSGTFPSKFEEINLIYVRLGYTNKVELS